MMHKLVIAVFCGTLLVTPIAQARVVTYRNCTELNKVYKGGVALPGAKNKGGKTRFTPMFNKALYDANKSKDRDKDGIACEQ
jgi:hypothetical protein